MHTPFPEQSPAAPVGQVLAATFTAAFCVRKLLNRGSAVFNRESSHPLILSHRTPRSGTRFSSKLAKNLTTEIPCSFTSAEHFLGKSVVLLTDAAFAATRTPTKTSRTVSFILTLNAFKHKYLSRGEVVFLFVPLTANTGAFAIGKLHADRR